MRTYRVVSLDVWGNAKDGFWVNGAYYTQEYVELKDNASDMAINRKLGIRGVVWDGDPEYALYGEFKNGKPALHLERYV